MPQAIIMNMPIAVYVFYVLYVVYTGVYFYNRMHGKPAHFGLAHAVPEDSLGQKLLSDFCVGFLFFFSAYAMIMKTFFW